MKTIDQQKAQRVWARVQAAPERTGPDFRQLWLLAAQLDGLYRHFPEKEAGELRRSLGRTLRCLRGMQKLVGERPWEGKLPSMERPRQLIPACWHRERQLQQLLQAGPAEPILEHLRRESVERSMILAERAGEAP